MFGKHRMTIFIDNVECSIDEKYVGCLPACDEPWIYTTDYDGPVTYDMVESLLQGLINGFTSNKYWEYQRFFIYKYMTNKLPIILPDYQPYINARRAIRKIKYSCEYIEYIYDQTKNVPELGDIKFYKGRSIDVNHRLNDEATMQIVEAIVSYKNGTHPFDVYQHAPIELKMDRKIFGL